MYAYSQTKSVHTFIMLKCQLHFDISKFASFETSSKDQAVLKTNQFYRRKATTLLCSFTFLINYPKCKSSFGTISLFETAHVFIPDMSKTHRQIFHSSLFDNDRCNFNVSKTLT